ncbi:unnamed protein product, partial [Rotaria magnacalcarata]
YIRRRKNGQKRRSILVKRRTPINKPLKNESIITHDDSCIADKTVDDNDEHSQEYKPRRPVSIIYESTEEETSAPVVPSPKIAVKPPILKQLKLDQFLTVIPPEVDPLANEEPDIKSENSEEIHLQSRRISRNTRLNSTSKFENSSESSNKPDPNYQDSLTRQISESDLSVASSNDTTTTTNTLSSSSTFNMDRSLPLKKCSLTPLEIQALIDSTVSPIKSNTDQSNTITKAPSEVLSSLSDMLSNPLLSSINGTDDETKIAHIESQLKTSTGSIVNDNEEETISSINSYETTIEPIETTDDDQPPSLTSPTSMIVSQSNHYNYPIRTKQQQQQEINNFNPSTSNMTYNYANPSYPYSPYPPAPSFDMQSYYYHQPTIPMDYMPYYPTSSPTGYLPAGPIYGNTSEQPTFYTSNDVNTIPYNGNGNTPYIYPTPQPPHQLYQQLNDIE